ncbi:chromosome partition protein [Streptococcus dysgalactiae subsp. equisimilis]|nr:chromosome partition protein [Streptococcus dysgalactiae subsp. equisimilis]VTS99573.1 chromosome partition protein [Streptococcus dysgalactiae subsp. equisimilis]
MATLTLAGLLSSTTVSANSYSNTYYYQQRKQREESLNYKKDSTKVNINDFEYLTYSERESFKTNIEHSYDENYMEEVVRQALALSNEKRNLMIEYDSLINKGHKLSVPVERNELAEYNLQDLKQIVKDLQSSRR